MNIIDMRRFPKATLKLADIFRKNNYQLFLVGGSVRDSLLGLRPKDWDFCTNARPEAIIRILSANGVAHTEVGIDYGTVVAYINDVAYEITTFRRESDYCDGRHPLTVMFANDIVQDLERRDFTINAMAFNMFSCELIDPYGGAEDLMSHKLCTIGDASDTFREDGLRVLRALRFAIRFGLTIDEELDLALKKDYPFLGNISKERITDEFRKMFSYNKPIMNIFSEYFNVICYCIPELRPCVSFWQNNKYHKHDVYKHLLAVVDNCNTNKFEIKLAALLHDIGKPQSYSEDSEGCGHFYGHPKVSKEICKIVFDVDLKLTTSERELILKLVELHDMTIQANEKSIKCMLSRHGSDFLADWFILKQGDLEDHIFPEDSKYMRSIDDCVRIMNDIIASEACLTIKDLAFNGNDVMSVLGIKSGKNVGEVLNRLLKDVIDGVTLNDYSSLRGRVLEAYSTVA